MDCVKCTVGPFWVNPFAMKVCVRRNDSNNYPSCALLSTLKHTLLSVGNSAVEKCLITSTVIILTICCDFVLPCYYRMRTGRNNFVDFSRLLWRGFYCAVCLWKNYIISLCRFISLLGKGGGWNIITLSLMNLCMFFSQQCNHLVWVTVVQYLYWLLFRTTECQVSVFGAFARCHNERRQLCTELDLWVLLAGGITLFSQWRNTVLCVLPGPSVEQDNPSPPFFQLTMQTPVVLSTVCGTSQERPARTTFFKNLCYLLFAQLLL